MPNKQQNKARQYRYNMKFKVRKESKRVEEDAKAYGRLVKQINLERAIRSEEE